MKKLFLLGCIVLSTTSAFAGGKWSGPTSPIDPLWGMKGSSIMSEALRSPDIAVVVPPMQVGPSQGDLDAAYERGKAEGSVSDMKFMLLLQLLEQQKRRGH
jgi:hypothetical protein